MRVRLSHVLLAALLGGVSSLGACVPPPVMAGAPANPYPPPPPMQPEQRPLPPVSEQQLVWRMGGWEWAGTGYVWQPGQWEPLAGHSNQYLPGHWTAVNGTWVWERGHWL
jgi:hypothetical protein